MYNKFSKMFTLALLCTAGLSNAQSIPSPKQHFGFNIGDDYKLTTYTQAEAYYKKLAASPRTKLVDIGMTEEGRHEWMLIVSSPENIKKLAEYKAISQKLARAENLTPAEAKQLAAKGKSVVWIDGGLHATETVGAHQLLETMYQLVTRTDEETTLSCWPRPIRMVRNWFQTGTCVMQIPLNVNLISHVFMKNTLGMIITAIST